MNSSSPNTAQVRSVQPASDVAIADGAVFEVRYPFKRTTFTQWDEDGSSKISSWAPGWYSEPAGPESEIPAWDGEGAEIRSVISVHKPGNYPARVFYTRQWRDPNGNVFGKPGLRMTTVTAFRKWRRHSTLLRLSYERDHPGRSYASHAAFMALVQTPPQESQS